MYSTWSATTLHCEFRQQTTNTQSGHGCRKRRAQRRPPKHRNKVITAPITYAYQLAYPYAFIHMYVRVTW